MSSFDSFLESAMIATTQVTPFFSKTLDMRSRSSMVEFLTKHYRYDTMGSHNRSTSYAHHVKIHSIGLAKEQVDKAYDYFLADDAEWFERDRIIDQFTQEQGGRYTIGSNGRNGGYLVLYQSQYEESPYKSRCRSCGQLNCKTTAESLGNKCGRCGAEGETGRADFSKPLTDLKTWPGRSTDMYEEFSPEDWSMDALRERVRLVQAFDAACDAIRESFIEMLDESELRDVEVVVTKTIKRFGAAE
jgi:hypothetical protein